MTACLVWGKSDWLDKQSESELFTGDTPKDNHSPGLRVGLLR